MLEALAEARLWHPVALATDLGAAPLALELLQQPLVLWRDEAGTPRAFTDRCPHRGARLSLGRVCAGRLECPYHGWRFDGEGRSREIPALPGFVPPPAHQAVCHQVCERYGLLWVKLLPSDAALPAFAAEDDARLRKVCSGPYEVQSSGPRIVENFLDMAHFSFVHEGWLGAREQPLIEDYRVDVTPTGFLASGCKAFQPQSSIHAQDGAQVEYTYEVNAPYTAVLTKVPDPRTVQIGGFRESIALFICPITPERCRVWFRLAMNDFESPDTKLTAFQDTIFSQDQPVLESQSPKRLPITEAAPVKEVHCATDRSSAAYRRYLREQGITFGVC